jgi:hypothetical protein
MLYKKYDDEEGPVPQYEISKDLSYLTIAFIVSSVVLLSYCWWFGNTYAEHTIERNYF